MTRFACGCLALGCLLFRTAPALADYNFVSIDFPGAISTEAHGINNDGDIVGRFYDGSAWRGFIQIDGQYIAFDWSGAVYTELSGINDRRDMVGTYGDGSGLHGFWLPDELPGENFDFPGSTETHALGINMLNQIVGWYGDA